MAPPPLPPLSCVAGSLALSFTGAAPPAQPIAEPVTRDAIVPELPEAPPAAPAADPLTDPFTAPSAATVAPQPTQPIDPPAPVISTWPNALPVAPPRTHLLRPTEKRFFFQLFVGGAKTLLGGYSFPYGGGGMDFKLEGAIGGHGKRRKSLAGAAVVQYRTGVPFSSFTLAPRLQWDKQIVPDHAIYLTTTATLGYRLTSYSGYGLAALVEGYHGGVASVGWGISAIVAERVLLTFRPVNPELEFNGLTRFTINWDVFGGLGVVW